MAKAILDAAAEHKKKEHVAQKVWPASVEKHGDQDGNEPAFHRQGLEAAGRCVTPWNDGVVGDQPIEMMAERKFKFERPQIEENKQESGNPEPLAANVVVNGNRKHPAAF